MKKRIELLWVSLVCSAVVGLPTACQKQPERTEATDHDHGTEVPETRTTADEARPCEHNVPLNQCGICRPELIDKLAPGQSVKVRLPSTNSMRFVGIETATPQTGTAADVVECFAEVSFDQNKVAQIAAPVGGVVEEVLADLGTKVTERQSVARIWSAAIAEAVAKAVLTHQTLERERRLRADKVTSEKDLQEAEASHRAACQQLRTLGFTEEQIDELGGKPQERVLMDVRAPFAGEIIERSAVRGALVETGKPLFTIADASKMWAMLQVPEAALGRLKEGQSVELKVDSLPGQTFEGKITWIGLAIDERTRMGRVRAEFPNPAGRLKDKMFAKARILTRKTEGALLVPSSALQLVQGRALVFVKQGEDLFDARAIEVGSRFNGELEVVSGLRGGEQVAVSHAFALKSALLMSRLGAGCADD